MLVDSVVWKQVTMKRNQLYISFADLTSRTNLKAKS